MNNHQLCAITHPGLRAGFAFLLFMVSNGSHGIAFTTDASFLNPQPAATALTTITNNVIDAADVSSSTFTWGTPISPSSSSSLTFTGINDTTMGLPADGTDFTFGFFTFINGVTSGEEATSVDLSLNAYECDGTARCDSTFFDKERHNTDPVTMLDIPINVTLLNTSNTDPVLASINNADNFCIDIPVVGQVCAWTREDDGTLLQGTSTVPTPINFGVFEVIGRLGSITITDIISRSPGTFTTLGSDPTKNVRTAVPVSEPSVLALLGLGLLGMGFVAKKRKT